ncbi:DUF4232 domain-containing protein [Streptomyces sp. Pv4-95]|uniref:DUF4232 domain-containing protein n=1 Tax=Streptomyces sp. Pv4-95 TaxID=3049543 RepID=UPI0038926C8F
MPHTDATHTTATGSSHRTASGGRRTARSRTLRIAAATLTAVAALGLTACGGQGEALHTGSGKPFNPAPQDSADTSGKDPSAKGSSAKGSSAKEAAAPAEADGETGQGSGAGAKEGASTGATGGGKSATRSTSCDAVEIRIVARSVNQPVNHLLLEATNTSSTACDLYAAPYLRFGEAQSPLPELPDSKPQSVVTLAPGATGYAAVMTSSADGSGSNGRTVNSLEVHLPGRDGKGSVGGPARVALPGGSVRIDDSAWVTYWQTDASSALTW